MAENYKVTGITKTVSVEPGKHAAPALEVTFVTRPHEIAGSVVIPTQAFTEDEVARAVGAQAAVLERVMGL